MQPKIYVVDTETTGMEGDIVEVAVIDLSVTPWVPYTTLCLPKCPIEIQAMAIHHITPDMVEEAPTPGDALSEYREPDYFVAHNAEFDKRFMSPYVEERPWICTWRCALSLWPDAPGHSNQELRYWLEIDLPDFVGERAHRALY